MRSRLAVVVAALSVAAVAGGCAAQPRQPSAAPLGTSSAASSSATASPAPSRSPTGTSTSPTARPAAPITIAFAGDIHFEGIDASRLARDPATAIGPIAPTLGAADFTVVNLETAITTGGTRAPKQYAFRAPPSAFRALAGAGVDVATVANNHGEDYGPAGLADTLADAKRAGFPIVGAGDDEAAAFAPYVATVRGQRVAVLGATQVIDTNLIAAWSARPHKAGLANAKDLGRTVQAVRDARKAANIVVVYLHYGHELTNCPTESQRRIAGALVDAGADVVVGSHAHVLLGGGWKGSSYVDYGLGNFVWYSAHSPQTAATGVLTLTLHGRRVTKAHWTPATISAGIPLPVTGRAADAARETWRHLRNCTDLSSHPPR